MQIYFLIPVYNEFNNIPLLAERLNNSLTNYPKLYLFVDDCSSDGTVTCINECFENTDFIILQKEKNFGPGHSFNLGFEWILEHSQSNDDIIITMEADNTSDLSILQNMVSISNLGFSLVLASVYAQGGGFDQTTFFRKIISFIANMLFRFVFDIKVLTLSSFYRVYSLELIKEIKSRYTTIISENGFISMIEILIKSIKLKAKIIEVPMVLHSQLRKGKSKMKIVKTSIKYIHFLFFNGIK